MVPDIDSDQGDGAAPPRVAQEGSGADGRARNSRRFRAGAGAYDPYDGRNVAFRFTAYGIRNPWILWEMRQQGGLYEEFQRPVCLQDFGDEASLEAALRLFPNLVIETDHQLR